MKTRIISRLGAALLALCPLCLCAAPVFAAAPGTGAWPGIEGEITKTLPFRDSTGDNTLVLTARETSDGDARSREIFAYLFRKEAGGAARRIWRVYDFEKDCEYHVDADFDESRVEITDLDKDGVSEIWLPYSLGCTSEVSPVEMKIIMYEGGQKHAMRGLSRDPWALNERRGGGTMDAAFRSGPAAFRDHARKLWKSIDDDYIQPYLLAEAERHPIADVRVDKRVLTCVVNGKPARLAFDADVPDLPVADGFTEVDFAVADVTGDGVDDLLVRVFIVGNTWVETLSDGHVYEAKGGELVEALSIPADGFGRWKPKSSRNLGICPGPDGTLAIDASAGKFDDDGEAGTFLLVRQGGDWTVKDAPKGFECSDAELAPAGASAQAMSDAEFAALCSEGTAERIQQALKDGANPNAEDEEGVPALMLAIANRNPGTAEALLAAGAKVNVMDGVDGGTPLIWAADGDVGLVRALLAAGAEINVQNDHGVSALMVAASYGKADIVAALLEAGADPSLEDNGENEEERPLDALWHARHPDMTAGVSEADQAETVRLLQGGGGQEMERGAPERVGALLAGGAEVDARDTSGDTALIRAATLCHAETVRALLTGGADVNAVNNSGETALMRAAQPRMHGDVTPIVAVLLEAGAGAFSPAELKRMSTFVSNFAEVRFLPDFDMQKGDAPPNLELIRFGIEHNYINNFKSRIKHCLECTHGSMSIDAKFVAESVKKYFDLDVQHRSVPRTDDWLSCHFDGTRYHFDGADGELVSYAKVKRAVREGGFVRMSGDLYQEDTNDIVGSFTVTAKPHKWNGKDTWAILSLKRERR